MGECGCGLLLAVVGMEDGGGWPGGALPAMEGDETLSETAETDKRNQIRGLHSTIRDLRCVLKGEYLINNNG